jgi:hypothetical protein
LTKPRRRRSSTAHPGSSAAQEVRVRGSHRAVIRVYDQADDVVETHQHAGQFKEHNGTASDRIYCYFAFLLDCSDWIVSCVARCSSLIDEDSASECPGSMRCAFSCCVAMYARPMNVPSPIATRIVLIAVMIALVIISFVSIS